MGSGHILVYAFDVLLQIYTSCGWSERDAAKSIIENNLYGLDIDDRAGQLAYFAVMMKARKYNRRILNGAVKPNVLAIQDSGFMTDEFIAYVAEKDTCMKADLTLLRSSLKDAKEYGSILHMPKLNFAALYERIDIISRSFAEDMFQISYQNTAVEQLLPLVKQAEVMAQKYDVVVTNPPYMAVSNAGGKVNDYVKKNFPDSKADLFAVFIERCGQMAKKNGYQAMITQHAWMFLSSFEKLRTKLLAVDIVNMAHLGARAFEEIGGEVVQTTSFVIRKSHIADYKGEYCRLIEPTSQQGKEDMFLSGENRYAADQSNFSKIPGSPVAYWVSNAVIAVYNKAKLLGDIASPRTGMTTGDNNRFLRLWYEIAKDKVGSKYEFYSKGSDFRRWYCSVSNVILWENNGDEVKNFKGSTIRNEESFFKKCIVWNLITSGAFSARAVFRHKCVMGDASPAAYVCEDDYLYTLACLNSKPVQQFLNIINPTINCSSGVLSVIPIAQSSSKAKTTINEKANETVNLSIADWDSFETSWDFKRNPLAPSTQALREQMASQFATSRMEKFGQISWHYENWKQECEERFQQLKKNEEELNRIFIDIYGLQDELTPDVADKDVTVHRVFDSKDDVPESMKGSNYVRTMRDEIVSLISYAVGCMFGRYSLDVDGLAYAGGGWDASKYKTIIPDGDNIIPICDDEYFDDDLANKIFKWVEIVYGKETLEENLRFIAAALGGKGTAREVIRNYLLNGFYADHLKTYQKRPIYWQFSSGKKNGFKALIYMHRYQPDLLARMRTDYVHEQQERYRTQIQMLEDSLASAAPSERVKLNKQIAKLKDQTLEIQKYEEKIHHLADQMIAIDLDDGVKVNYAKFQDVLEKIK